MALAIPDDVLYTASTEAMQVVPEASSRAEGASVAFPDVVPCSDTADLDWVPDVEQVTVPEPLRQVCWSCPSRAMCLQWAVSSRSQGYWAGTTTTDRQTLARGGRVDVPSADARQAALERQAALDEARDQAVALHAPGEDSLRWYRRGGCRCRRCRTHNAEKRSQERARQRQTVSPSAA